MINVSEPAPQRPNTFERQDAYVEALPLARFGLNIWQSKVLIVLAAVIGLVAAAIVTLIIPPSYDARILVAPVQSAVQSPSNQQLSNLASAVAGVNLNLRADNAKFDEFQHLLSSLTVADHLEKDHHVMAVIFRREWDSRDGKWVPPRGILADVKRGIFGAFGLPAWAPPTPARLSEYLSRDVKIVSDSNSNIISISYANKDPAFAANLLTWMCEETDHVIKAREEEATREQIAYIDDKLRTIQIAEHRRVLTDLLLELERNAMMLAINQPYAATVIDGPRVPDLPSSPNPFLALAVGSLGGFTFGCAIAVYRNRHRHLPVMAG